MSLPERVKREKRTVGVMIQMYCKHYHVNAETPCSECVELIEFANTRINKCIFQENKPVCSECQVHCYRQDMRDKIKKVMRFAGPKMIYTHPILGIRHLIDKKRFEYIDPKVYQLFKKP